MQNAGWIRHTSVNDFHITQELSVQISGNQLLYGKHEGYSSASYAPTELRKAGMPPSMLSGFLVAFGEPMTEELAME